MNDEELTEAIEDLVADAGPYVWVNDDHIALDAMFTCQEIVAIAELLKKEGRV